MRHITYFKQPQLVASSIHNRVQRTTQAGTGVDQAAMSKTVADIRNFLISATVSDMATKVGTHLDLPGFLYPVMYR